jgi:uncharacterized membrane protein YphA (DoxX/SURF4 family)
MPSQSFRNLPLRPWIAPALGAGLLLAGLAMVLGVSSAYGPIIAAAVAAVILWIGHWRTTRATGARARKSA